MPIAKHTWCRLQLATCTQKFLNVQLELFRHRPVKHCCSPAGKIAPAGLLGSAAAAAGNSSVKSMSKWKKNITALRQYVEKNGNALVPTACKWEIDGETVSLGSWVTYVRIKHRTGSLSVDRSVELSSFPGWEWGPCKPGPTGNPERDNTMMSLRHSGRSLQSIGDEYGLSRQRVHQIVRSVDA